jgi:hypothetical protein
LLAGTAREQDSAVLLSNETEHGNPVSAHTYHTRTGDHLVIFSARQGLWDWRGINCDAEFLYYGVSDGGEESLFMTGGSYVTIGGDPIIDCIRPLQRVELSGPGGKRVSCSDSSAVRKINPERMRVLERVGKGLGQSS